MQSVSLLSIIISVYNEEDVLVKFYNEMNNCLENLKIEYEIVFVNDGSTDKSLQIISKFAVGRKNIKIVNLSKNFGHEAAMIAGIDYSCGDAVICMDADLQHPPLLIADMIRKFSEGYEIVNMKRTENQSAGIIKRITSSLFYYLLNKISPVRFEPNASDFFLISKRVANILKNEYRERARFIRGFIQIVGFKRTYLEFIAAERVGGKSKYSFIKLFKFSMNAILTFSNLPLILGVLASIIVGIFGILVAVYSIIMKMRGYSPSGYTTIVVMISLLFSAQFFITGIIGEYLGFVFSETKKRPIYIIDKIIDMEKNNYES